MANDLATLTGYLTTALRDPTYATWTLAEQQDLITWAVDRLYPRIRRLGDPTNVANQITLIPIPTDGTPGTYTYTLPAGIRDIFRIDQIDSSGNYLGEAGFLAWQISGDYDAGTQVLRVGPRILQISGTLMLYGWTPYDVVSVFIPDRYIKLVLSIARAEAYRRVAADRERFTSWLSRNQVQNMTVGDLVQFIHEADVESQQEWTSQRTQGPPVPGRRA